MRGTVGNKPSDSRCCTITAKTPEHEATSRKLNCSASFIGAALSIAAHRGAPFQRRSNSALPTTLTLLKAIAAPAITGLSMPNAASGIPTPL